MYITLVLADDSRQMIMVRADLTTAQLRDQIASALALDVQKDKCYQIRALTHGRLIRFSDELYLADYAAEDEHVEVRVFLAEVQARTHSVFINGVLYRIVLM